MRPFSPLLYSFLLPLCSIPTATIHHRFSPERRTHLPPERRTPSPPERRTRLCFLSFLASGEDARAPLLPLVPSQRHPPACRHDLPPSATTCAPPRPASAKMSTGQVNDGAGPSKQMTVKEEAREANMPFWRFSQRAEEEQEIATMDDNEEDIEGEYDAGTSDGHEDDTTDAGGERTDGTEDGTTDAGERTDAGRQMDGGAAPTAKKKAARKNRDPPTLGTERGEFTEVTQSGAPMAPATLAAGYEIQLGCIVRETLKVNTRNLRDPDNAHFV